MKIINEALLDETTGRAKQSPRLRMNYNFHEHLDDPVNRLLNALEPGTYLRPHRHLNPKKMKYSSCCEVALLYSSLTTKGKSPKHKYSIRKKVSTVPK